MPMGYLLINTETGHTDRVLEELRKMDVVEEAYMLYGTYDIIAKIKTDSMEELTEIVINARLLDKVRQTQTMIVM